MSSPLTFTPGAGDQEVGAQQAAEQLEAFFVRRMLAEMRSSIGNDGLLGGGQAGKMFQEMLDEAMADEISASGGMGIADMMGSELGAGAATKPVPSSTANAKESSQTEGLYVPPVGGAGARAAVDWGYRQSSGNDLRNMPVDAPQSSPFGQRIHPVTGAQSFHKGVDLAAPMGTPVQASGPGVVVQAGPAGTYGNIVVLDHGGNLETRYAHLEHIEVKVGQQIAAGESLGTVGATGRVTGPHLHFEVRRGGKAIDPMREVQKVQISSQDKHKPADR